AIEILRSLDISFANTLGVGDSSSDWQFIELCQYGAAVGNASEELKKLVTSKGKEFSYIGPTVDENGIIDILNHFLL
ncbi:MAG: HAD hydrolase family protein, partial [Patescibacteria group bacterium]